MVSEPVRIYKMVNTRNQLRQQLFYYQIQYEQALEYRQIILETIQEQENPLVSLINIYYNHQNTIYDLERKLIQLYRRLN